MKDNTQNVAIFVDFENLAIGLRERKEKFDLKRILGPVAGLGAVSVKRAYGGWKPYAAAGRTLHEAGFDLFEIPSRRISGKNFADIRMCVDILDLAYSKPHLASFVIVSGDSDFSPLVAKLRENNKYVLGIGLRDATSPLLREACNEFIFYEDAKDAPKKAAAEAPRPAAAPRRAEPVPAPARKAAPEAKGGGAESFPILLRALEALRGEKRNTLWSSLVKTTMRKLHPGFHEKNFGYRTFSQLLEDAQKQDLVKLSRDATDRTYIITEFGGPEPARPARSAEPAKPARAGSRRRRRR